MVLLRSPHTWPVVQTGHGHEAQADAAAECEMDESDDKTKALLQFILKEIQDDPEYSAVNH